MIANSEGNVNRVWWVIGLLAVGWLVGGCGVEAGGPEVPRVVDSQACYADAQAQLSPQWASASRLERAIVAFQVITTCEGGR